MTTPALPRFTSRFARAACAPKPFGLVARLQQHRTWLQSRWGGRVQAARFSPMARVPRRLARAMQAVRAQRSLVVQVALRGAPARGTLEAAQRCLTRHSMTTQRVLSRQQLHMVQRVLMVQPPQQTSTERVETRTVRHIHSVRVEQHTSFPRLSLNLVRSAASLAARAAAPAVAPPTPRDNLRSPLAARAAEAQAAALTLPPQELSRVTDHVIRQLDRRVLSYQERHGIV